LRCPAGTFEVDPRLQEQRCIAPCPPNIVHCECRPCQDGDPIQVRYSALNL
jgi:hypothetical protein